MLFLERKYFLKEIGFWDYSCPRHGSLERYNENDWDILLDDMAQGGFNSLVLGVKWLTTGYRSRFPWLDRDPACSAVKTDNGILHYALNAARARQIKTRLLIVENQFPVKTFGLEPVWAPEGTKEAFGEYFGCYDLDHPGLRERMLEMTDEIVRLFGAETDGFVLELEFGDRDEPHRVDIYNRWARENGRPDYKPSRTSICSRGVSLSRTGAILRPSGVSIYSRNWKRLYGPRGSRANSPQSRNLKTARWRSSAT